MLEIAGAMAGIAGGIGDYFGNRETNATNVDLAAKANAFNAEEAAKMRAFASEEAGTARAFADQQGHVSRLFNQAEAEKDRNYQERMSSTAYQRSTADMRAAGINPMLAVSNGGASSPGGRAASSSPVSGASASGGSPAQANVARVNNPYSGLGASLANAIPSALSAMNLKKDLEAKDAGIAATQAAGLASVANANNANASAKATAASMGRIHSESRSAGARADMDISEAQRRKATAEFDKAAVKYDGVSKRVLEAIGGVTDAVNIKRILMGTDRMQRDGLIREERHLNNQGQKGSRLP